MRTATLTARFCKVNATYFKRIVPTDIKESIRFDYGVPFKIGILNGNENKEFNVPNIQTQGTTYTIQFFKELDLRVGDKVEFDNKTFYVVDTNYSFYNSTRYRVIKQYFATLK